MTDRCVKVSAMITAYNHERFIGQAIEGFLMQRTKFPCELVIVDDCSTDGTRDVMRKYQEKWPDRIRAILNRHNLGGYRTLVRAYDACRGQYVAPMDGDDYWVSPDKLQRQADLLDERPDCAMCFHSVTMVWEDGVREPAVLRPGKVRDTYTLTDLLDANFIGACSPLYRKGLFAEHPAWFFLTPVADWPHHILHARHGNIGYIDEPLGVYRQHGGGVYSKMGRAQRLGIAIECLRRFRCALDRGYRPAIARSLSAYYLDLARVHLEEGNVAAARACARKCVLESVSGARGLGGPRWRVLAAAYAPGLHRWARRLRHRESLDRADPRGV